MYPGAHAVEHPDRPAVILDGADPEGIGAADETRVLTYGQLEERSVRLAHMLRDAGLTPGAGVALLATNDPRVFEVYWACLRSGFYLTAVNTYLSAPEAAYIVDDCDAQALIASADLADLAPPCSRRRLASGVRSRGMVRCPGSTTTTPRSRRRRRNPSATSHGGRTCSTARERPAVPRA